MGPQCEVGATEQKYLLRMYRRKGLRQPRQVMNDRQETASPLGLPKTDRKDIPVDALGDHRGPRTAPKYLPAPRQDALAADALASHCLGSV